MSNPGRGHADSWEPGAWNAVCFQCGFKFKSNELKRNWKNEYVCDRCWEPRHPQDFVKAVPDNTSVPWSQPARLVYVGPSEPIIAENLEEIQTEDFISIYTEST